ncbi:MAG TPA: valine--tRNA ligase [Streptosporangiaceae bacterium]|nr:valine--tRNA ligase [Streptosporangiaceae bacterium]
MEPGDYDHRAVEAAARALWESYDIYRYDPGGPDEPAAARPTFSVDTPPPYVSAAHLHVGHAMSYSQPDFIVRYRRMRGERVFYPIGFDDNGLPTERYVEQAYGVRAVDLPRAEFVALCLAETQRTAARYEDLWRRLGLSLDWSLRYSTIDARCQRTAQASFVRLHETGYVRRAAEPILWCPEDRTSLAQADVEDLERTSRLYTIRFGEGLVIATTRPELLPACVALYHHPADSRYAGLRADARALVPLFDYEVPVLADEDVDPEYGTGLMMVCTFGDSEDVLRWRRDHLALRLVVEPDGRLGELAGEFAGLTVSQGRSAIVKALEGAGRLAGSVPVRQVVGVHERCQIPVEFQIRPQWFVAVRENADRFRARAAELEWIPPFMRRRLEDWIDGLKWDWNITRQRRYGVPFPVWFCSSCDAPVLARPQDLPVDPLTDAPPVTACPSCGSAEFTGDPDVMDTWMTSSLTPQINDGWALGGTDPALAPMSMRVQAFEIIRTWLFYSVVQSELLFGRLPWRTALISGWGLSEQGKKLSKRDLDRSTGPDGYNRYVPDDVMGKYGADALRLWATRGRIGTDLKYNEKDIRTGRKFAVKLWNVGRFLTLNRGEFSPSRTDFVPPGERDIVDRWVLSHLAETVVEATVAFEGHDYHQAHQAASRMFWSIYCDRYIEMIKDRVGDGALPDGTDLEYPNRESRDSARWTLWESYRVLLGLFAPFAPFVTEHMYQRFYRDHENVVSLHLTRWPAADPAWAAPAERVAVDQLAVILDATRALRSGLHLGNSARLSQLILQARDAQAEALLARIAEPLRIAARAGAVVRGPAAHPSGVDGITVGVVA